MENKDRFLKVYSNLPLGTRDEVILVLPDKGPITWNAAYLEIKAETPSGQEIFNKLIELNFI